MMINSAIKIFVSGDFCPIHRIENLLETSDINQVFGELAEQIESADLAITNLECPLTLSNNPIEKTGPSLKGLPKTSLFLKSAGFKLVTLANNHIMDFGKQGLLDTIHNLEKNKLHFVGAGLNGYKASSTFFFNKNGVKIAIVNFTENEWSTTNNDNEGANPINPVVNFQQIRDAKENADKVIVISHGGHEMYKLPSPRMKKLFRFYIDAGADIVINHHTHCISGNEIYHGKPIFYSLGNFIFDNPSERNGIWNTGMTLRLIITKNQIKFETIFISQCNKKPGVQILNDKEIITIQEEIKTLNKIISNDAKLEEHFEDYVENKSKLYKSYIEPRGNKYILGFQNRKLLPSFWVKRKRKYLLNLVRCESHRDVLIKILENENSYT